MNRALRIHCPPEVLAAPSAPIRSQPSADAARDDSRLDVTFSVPYVHRLRFTDDIFGADQRVLLDLLEPSGDRPPRVQFWLDEHVATAQPLLPDRIAAFVANWRDRLEPVGEVEIVPGGETIKNDIHILERMLKVLHGADLDRRSYVVAIGGGAVLDAVGFAVAIAHRGLRLVRLPTTTLAQADSGIGVKNGVNLFQKKNWLGSFAVPWGVINDAGLLRTLSDRDFVCGFAEAVKVSLLKSEPLLSQVCHNAARIRARDPGATLPILRQSALLHLDHITRGGDPFEMNEARPLDFGHWSAHRLESLTDFKLRHGEAVAIGVAIDSVYASRMHGFPVEDAERVIGCLAALGFPLAHPALQKTAELFAGLEEFRQHLGGRLTLTMMRRVGEPIEVHEVDRREMVRAIEAVTTHPQAVASSRRRVRR